MRALIGSDAIKFCHAFCLFQIEKWGNVEWHHDVDLMELRARISSATLFIHLNSEDRTLKQKESRR